MNLDFAALGKGTKILLVAGFLLFIDSFLQWQQVSIGFVSVGQNEWHGIGVLAALLVIALLVWEGLQLAGVTKELQLPVPATLVSVALAASVTLFTIIKFFVAHFARHWPAWIGLVLAIAVAVGGWLKLTEGSAEAPAVAPTSDA